MTRMHTIREIRALSLEASALATALGLGAVLALGAASAAAAPPDILGIRAGMSPGDAYQAVQAFDPTHRAVVAQIAIPELLGAKPAAFQITPETVDANKDMLVVNLTLPPNPQQVWQVRRLISGINTTRERLVAQITEKYGPNFTMTPGGGYLWPFDEKGQPLHLSPQDVKDCQWVAVPATELDIPTLPAGNGVITGKPPLLQHIPPAFDPSKHRQCPGLVWVKVDITGGGLNWAMNIELADFSLQNRTSFALMDFFNGIAAKQQQKATDSAQHSNLPTL